MQELERPISKAWRLLRFQRFVSGAIWSLGFLFLIAAVLIGVDRVLPTMSLPIPIWAVFAIAGGVGAFIAGLIALFTGPSKLDAAVAIDRSFGLNERLGTAVTLPIELRETPAGRALLSDALSRVESLDIASRFRPRIPKTAWVPLVPIALGLAFFFFAPELTQRLASARSNLTVAEQEEVIAQAQELRKRLAEVKKELEEAQYAESADLLVQIEKAAEDLEKAPPADKEQALVKLNQLTNALEERQKQIGDAQQVSRKLQRLNEMSNDGPADEFAREMAKGDFEKAAEAVKELKDKLLAGDLSEKEQEQLNKQLNEMKEQLNQLANLDERKKQLQDALDSGQINQEQFDRQMARLNDQAEDLQKLQQLAEQLAQAQQQLNQGDLQQAAEALGMSQDQLEQMAADLAELEMLDSTMADLQMAKNGMTGGDGLNQLGDRLGGMNGFGQRFSNNNNASGRGRGAGDREIAEDDTSTFNTRVRQQLGRGRAVQEGFGRPGAQTIGQSLIESEAAVQANAEAATEALSNQRVPRHIEEHVRGYIDTFGGDE